MSNATQPLAAGAAPADTRRIVLPEATAERAVARTREVLDAGVKLIGREVAMPEIRFDLRGQAAGQFRMDAASRALIRYNPALLARHETEFLAQTVPHEVAHYLTLLHFGRGVRPHGEEWRQIMRALGTDPSRCHQFDVSGIAARRVRRFAYHCDCGDHALTSIRHHRVLRGARYLCKRCGQALRAGRAGTGGET
jgi:SprT protein